MIYILAGYFCLSSTFVQFYSYFYYTFRTVLEGDSKKVQVFSGIIGEETDRCTLEGLCSWISRLY